MTPAERLTSLVSSALGRPPAVQIRAWDGSLAGPAGTPIVEVRSRQVLRRLLWEPNELGLAQCYVSGQLDVLGDSSELAGVLRACWHDARLSGREPVQASVARRVGMAVSALRLGAVGRRPPPLRSQARLTGVLHSKSRDRAVISHHYDLSNAFYALILDPSMAYSSAYYASSELSLAQAQAAKLDLICRKLGLLPGMRLLDVGCGWGALSLYAACHYGAQVVAVTISEQQYAFVRQQIEDRGLSDRVHLRLQDYRDIDDAPFDAIGSIEMGEHVGQAQYPTFLGVLFDHLAPAGRLLLQQMSRAADAAPGGGPFIENYIAPDMHMRPPEQTISQLRAAGFQLIDVQAFGEHYVRTVADWLVNLDTHYEAAVALVGEETARVWRLYLTGGKLSFEEGRMGVEQYLATRSARPAA